MWLLAGAAWGGVLAVALWPRPSGTLAGDLVAGVVAGQIGRLNVERRKHLEMAGISTENVVNWIVGLAFFTAMLFFLVFVEMMHLGWMGLALAVVLGGLAGWSVPLWATVGPYRKWQREVSVGLPSFVTYLSVYLKAGYTPRGAMERATALAPQPFRGEMETAIRTVQRLGSPEAAFEALVARVGIPELDQVLTRLAMLWNQQIDPEILSDMNAQFDAVREIALARSLAAGEAQMIFVAFAFAFGVMTLGIGAIANYIVSHAGIFLGV